MALPPRPCRSSGKAWPKPGAAMTAFKQANGLSPSATSDRQVQDIVTGAYGRGPLAERVLGGVTRDLLKTADLHWFMAS